MVEIKQIVSDIKIHPSRVFLMPEGRTHDEQLNKQVEVAELCAKEGFNFTPRLHIQLWGARRGV